MVLKMHEENKESDQQMIWQIFQFCEILHQAFGNDDGEAGPL
jgi:hypothetical protein